MADHHSRAKPWSSGLTTHRIDIDAHGRLVPRDDAARRLLADRAGRFLLLPSAPDLLVARRTPTVGGSMPRPRCVLAGDLSAFPIADFVAFIHQSRLSGLLTVSSSGLDRAVAFKDGEVRGAHSEAIGERVGEVALRLGYLTREQLAAAVAASSGKLFGRVLVEKCFVSPSDLWKCLHEQVAGVFHAILLSREGVFAMVDEPDVDLGTPLAVNTQSLLMDGIRRIDEMGLFRARIPGPQAYLRRREPKAPITLKPVEQQLLDLVDGRRCVAEIAQGAHLGEFDATKILYHLAEAGYVEAVAGPMASPAITPTERLEGIVSGMNAILGHIASALAPSGGLDSLLSAARTFLADPTSRFAPLWSTVTPGKDGTVDRAALLGNVATVKDATLTKLEPSGDPARLLFDGLRELMFFYLFQAAERLPRDADDQLGREVKRRFEALGDLR
ncbi:MAG: hypothetical protein A2V77_18500 [Anaeromyxobacter sp. RBG_16_69_14]|nr:MAG: hypothetical protein A2V77_18500 [Anaeromyxobacter sp. RBG_16_69_14]